MIEKDIVSFIWLETFLNCFCYFFVFQPKLLDPSIIRKSGKKAKNNELKQDIQNYIEFLSNFEKKKLCYIKSLMAFKI